MIDVPTAKAHLRVLSTDEDTLIEVYLAAAIAAVEKATGKLLTVQSVAQTAARFPCGERSLRLWSGPVDGDTAALTIAYDDADGVEQALTDFRLVEGSNARLLPAYGSCWPTAQAVRIGYTAGFATVPPEIDQAVLLLVGHFYMNREANAGGGGAGEMPMGVEQLLRDHRGVGVA